MPTFAGERAPGARLRASKSSALPFYVLVAQLASLFAFLARSLALLNQWRAKSSPNFCGAAREERRKWKEKEEEEQWRRKRGSRNWLARSPACQTNGLTIGASAEANLYWRNFTSFCCALISRLANSQKLHGDEPEAGRPTGAQWVCTRAHTKLQMHKGKQASGRAGGRAVKWLAEQSSILKLDCFGAHQASGASEGRPKRIGWQVSKLASQRQQQQQQQQQLLPLLSGPRKWATRLYLARAAAFRCHHFPLVCLQLETAARRLALAGVCKQQQQRRRRRCLAPPMSQLIECAQASERPAGRLAKRRRRAR